MMGRTVLLSHPDFTWREWLKEHRGERDWIDLDPADPAQSPPGRLTLWRGPRPQAWRFYGSLDPGRAPHVALAALATFLAQAGGEVVVRLFPTPGSALLRQTAVLACQLVRPDQILVPKGADIHLEGFPVGPEEVEIEAAFPAMVQQAQRKAQWLQLIENCSEHEVDLRRTVVEGARLGSGVRPPPDTLRLAGVEGALHAEVAGGVLLLVVDQEPSDQDLARALDVFHAGRAVVVEPSAYTHLLCSFARQDGEDFGFGMVREIDFAAFRARVSCTAVPPAPVRLLRLGGLRVDPSGRELGELRPWQA